ncbi:hypothetical protein WMY93_009641 [Mugilogobius chulae]|uniref:Cadherin domain-containing protein n=1 Tax=Mugilogobius chulae TaxID=88201 RepID=A0AAW0PQR0_9GOBI
MSYSITEEMKRGSVIGNIAKDIGLNLGRLSARRARVDFEDNGVQYCRARAGKPLELHRFTIRVQDINDNAPQFNEDTLKFEISELAVKGARFSLDVAYDGDIELDREDNNELSLVLTAFDGGSPQRSGTVVIHVTVLDANDNAPVFSQTVYKASLPENSPLDTLVITVTATDADEGINGEITYGFDHPSDENKKFTINPSNGEVRVAKPIDYEKESSYEIQITAKDGLGLGTDATLFIEIVDKNDNAPVLFLSHSLIRFLRMCLLVQRWASLMFRTETQGTTDRSAALFRLEFLSMSTEQLDRELVSDYNITITAIDEGSPPLSSSKTVHLTVADINDNPPVFEEQTYSAHVTENNKPGSTLCSVAARDPDWRQNGTVVYSLLPAEVNGAPVSSYVSVNGDTGLIHAVRAFDYEQFRSFKVHVMARDNGSPPLSSNVTVNVFISDVNDNSPQILYPSPEGNSFMTELIPKAAHAGSLVSKVIAVDADSGQNAWLSYHIVKSTDAGLFTIGPHSGEIKTQRDISESDSMKQNLIVQ